MKTENAFPTDAQRVEGLDFIFRLSFLFLLLKFWANAFHATENVQLRRIFKTAHV